MPMGVGRPARGAIADINVTPMADVAIDVAEGAGASRVGLVAEEPEAERR
jgi:hypothetical protein